MKQKSFLLSIHTCIDGNELLKTTTQRKRANQTTKKKKEKKSPINYYYFPISMNRNNRIRNILHIIIYKNQEKKEEE